MNSRIKVEWDEAKNEKNVKKHGLSFENAALVFLDDLRIERFDEDHSNKEERFVVIGDIGDVVFVVYTMRGEKIRLISARIATNAERRVYYGY